MGQILIASDLDLTILDLEALMRRFAPVVLGARASTYDPAVYNFGLGQEGNDRVYEYLIEKQVLATASLYPDELRTLWRIADRGDELAWVTARNAPNLELMESMIAQTRYCLAHNRIPYHDNLHFARRPREKFLICQKLGAVCLVDDHPMAVRTTQKAYLPEGQLIRAYLKHHAHNRAHRGIIRVRSMAEVEEFELAYRLDPQTAR